MNDLIDTNNRLKLRIKQLETTINLCEIKMKESEQSLYKKSNLIIGRDSEINHLKSSQNHMNDELKKLQLQNRMMNNELNQTMIRATLGHERTEKRNDEENLNKFITLSRHPTDLRRTMTIGDSNAFRHQKQISKKTEIVKRINVINK